MTNRRRFHDYRRPSAGYCWTLPLLLALTLSPAFTHTAAAQDWVFDPTPAAGLQSAEATEPREPIAPITPGTPAPEAPGDAVNLLLDDGSRESGIASSDGRVAVNVFTPDPADYPMVIDEVSVVFVPAKLVGEPVDIYLYEDLDGDNDPGTGAVLLAELNEVIQISDGSSFSIYPLPEPVVLTTPGDLVVAVVPRSTLPSGLFVSPGLDRTASQQRSWEGVYSAGEVPDPPTFPADARWGLVDDTGLAGNWMIRAQGLANVLYDQTDAIALGNGVVSQNMQTELDPFDSQVADDFTVDSPRGWVIEQVTNVGFYNLGPGPADSFNVAIAPDLNGAPSPMIQCNYPSTPPTVDDAGSLTLTLPAPCTLAPGDYWLMIQANLAAPTQLGGSSGQYRWNSRTLSNNGPAKYREPLNGSGNGCSDWTDVQTCFPTAGPDVAFRLLGTNSELIFQDSFESMDTSAWTSTSGAVSVVPEGLAGAGDWKLEVPVDGTSTKHHVQSSDAIDVASYNASFLIDVNNLDLGTDSILQLARVFDQNSTKLAELTLRQSSETNYKLLLSIFDDSGANISLGQLSVGASGPTLLEFQWQSATADGANDGMVRLLRNGNIQLENGTLDTDERRVGSIRLGAPKGSADITGEGGIFFMDDFVSTE